MSATRAADCHYCGRPGHTTLRGVVVCRVCVELAHMEFEARGERPLLRPPRRGLGA